MRVKHVLVVSCSFPALNFLFISVKILIPNSTAISRSEIERMLRKNDGDVAGTVDDRLLLSVETTQLASMPTSTFCRSQSAPSAEKSVKFSSTARRSMDDAMPSTVNTMIRSVSRLTADQVSRERALLEMLKKENERRLNTVCDEKEARMLEDEQLALLMQNKEFIRWLRKEQLRHPCPRVPEGPIVDPVPFISLISRLFLFFILSFYVHPIFISLFLSVSSSSLFLSTMRIVRRN
ncbi:hypothetical protein KIN20_008772 [Parelaphostrongylus tenuis]|uniref:Uncharacterized protein n=1 Tax=Parelaphostrongylus tenuis TaxID=148309 RepID=A0AAD5MQW0_PARTN|nr:hypothetical protein KIN20_008772 [Parelaphostrongylus tenuis]